MLGLVAILGCQSEVGISTPLAEPAAPLGVASTPPSESTPLGGTASASALQSDISNAGAANSARLAPLAVEQAPLPTPSRKLRLSPGKRSVRGTSGMVVSVNREATEIGVELLKSGANAVDAAIGVALALSVTHPSAGNLGGGGFALVRSSDGEVHALDFRESSPETLDRVRFSRMIRAGGEGPDSVGIPGTVAGLFELSARFGRKPFAELVEPARRLAEHGHVVSVREATALRVAWPKFREGSLARRLYGGDGGRPRVAGSSIRLPALAETLGRIQSEGKAGFYSGKVAASIRKSLGEAPQVTDLDLAEYRAIWRSPLVVDYRDLHVYIMPPPSAGGVALATGLLMLRAYDPSQIERGSTLHAHLLLEIMRRAQADRAYGVVDPDTLPVAERAAGLLHLLDAKRWTERCPIEPDHVTPNRRVYEETSSAPEMEHTTHLAVVDANGMAVSLTTTLSSGFGSKVITDTGVVLNNSLASFSGRGPNQPAPRRRTTSSMAPTLIEDATGLRLVLGTPGGDTIPSTLLQLVNALTDYSVPLDEAVDAPRLHQSIAPNGVARMERQKPIARALEQGLLRLGHRFKNPTGYMGHANSIAIIDGDFYGYVDPREGGLALGWSN